MAGLTVVDASALIAWLDDTDSHHQAAIELLTGIDSFLVHPERDEAKLNTHLQENVQ